MIRIRFAGILSTAILLAFTSAHGSSGGISSDCNGCHTGADLVDVQISGATEVMPGKDYTYTLTISGGPAEVGGFFVSADAGDLQVVMGDTTTQPLDGGIAQSGVKNFTDGSVSWDFVWTAPTVIGPVDFMAFGVSAIRDFNTLNDSTGILSSFSVQVIPVPAAVLLFSSGLALLGWMRRRPAG